MGKRQRRIEEIQLLVRTGKFAEARTRIQLLPRHGLPRETRLRLAHACHSVGLHTMTLSLMRPSVRPERTSGTKATPEELFEYGRALTALGRPREALGLLEPISPARLPRVVLATSWARFGLWEWKAALPELLQIRGLKGLTDHQRQLAEARYGTALLNGADDAEKSERVFQSVMRKADAGGILRLSLYSRLMLVQCAFHSRRWDVAIERLDDRARLYQDDAVGEFTARDRAWRALVRMARGRDLRRGVAEFEKTLPLFDRLRLWEELREVEYHATLLLKDERRIARFCFGTPYPAARARILTAAGLGLDDLPETYRHPLGSASGRTKGASLTLLDGAHPFSLARLEPGQALQRLLRALAQDFFAAPNVAVLHERVYPSEFFNLASSPQRIRQLMMRLRRWLSETGVPLTISENDGQYRLKSESHLSLLIHRGTDWSEDAELTRQSALLGRLEALAGKPFRAADVELRLGIGRSSAVALLRAATDAGRAERLGDGPATRYRLIDLNNK